MSSIRTAFEATGFEHRKMGSGNRAETLVQNTALPHSTSLVGCCTLFARHRCVTFRTNGRKHLWSSSAGLYAQRSVFSTRNIVRRAFDSSPAALNNRLIGVVCTEERQCTNWAVQIDCNWRHLTQLEQRCSPEWQKISR